MAIAQKTANNNQNIEVPDPGVQVEPSSRWVRVQIEDVLVADSRRVLLVRQKGRLPTYYFPREDVRSDLFEPGRQGSDGRQYWTVRVGDRVVEEGALDYPSPTNGREALKGYVAFKWKKMDHWYEEEEEVFAHARDPYHRVDTIASSRHIRVEVDGVTVAESTRPYVLFETGLPTRYYLPQEDVRMDLLESSRAHTTCPYKGDASYWTLKIGDQVYRNLVWGYLDPIPEAPKIRGLLCFFNEKVDVYVDGELEPRPESPWS